MTKTETPPAAKKTPDKKWKPREPKDPRNKESRHTSAAVLRSVRTPADLEQLNEDQVK